MESAVDAFQEIKSLEMELVDLPSGEKASRLQELLADEFLEFASSGMVIRKRNIMECIHTPGTATYQLSDFEFKFLGDEHILITYRSIKSAREIAY